MSASNNPTRQRKQKGSQGEQQARRYLQSKGYTILDQNFRTRFGEIDLIARQGEILAFIEVKHYAKTPKIDPLEVIHPRKIRHWLTTAKWYLATHPHLQSLMSRFDLIQVTDGQVTQHYENILETENG